MLTRRFSLLLSMSAAFLAAACRLSLPFGPSSGLATGAPFGPVGSEPSAVPGRASDVSSAFVDPARETGRLQTGVNRLRESQGLGELVFPAELQQLALARALEIAASGDPRHAEPGATEAAILPLLMAEGYAGRLAEHVILVRDPGDELAATVLRAWFEDEAHRADLLDPGYQAAGIGVAAGGRGWAVVQVLAESLPTGEVQP